MILPQSASIITRKQHSQCLSGEVRAKEIYRYAVNCRAIYVLYLTKTKCFWDVKSLSRDVESLFHGVESLMRDVES